MDVVECQERLQGKEAFVKEELCAVEVYMLVADAEGVRKFEADAIIGVTACLVEVVWK